MHSPSPALLRRLTWAIAILGVVLCLGATWHQTPTFDEPRHLEMGRQILLTGSWARFDNSKMPVSVLNALPTLFFSGPPEAPSTWFLPRTVQSLWLLATVLLAAAWARRCFGETAGPVAAAVIAFDPNLLAHAGLVTTDLPATFFVLAVLHTTWRAMESGGLARWLVAGATLGLAQAVKFSAIFLLPILVLVIPLSLVWLRRRPGLRAPLVWALAAWLALNAAYGFEGSLSRGSEIAWQSKMLSPLASLEVPLPFPRPWLEGLDWVRADDEHGSGNIYSEGRLTQNGQPDHYLHAVGWKFPLPLLSLGVLGLLWRRRHDGHRPLPLDLYVTWPILFLGGWFSLAFNYQIGIRYLLPCVPLLALLVSRLPWPLAVTGCIWTLASTLSWFPHLLSYQNERLLSRIDAWRVVGDSDLDWGQEGLAMERWKAENPNGLVDPDVPAPGPMLVSANYLTGVLGDPARMACLRNHLPPTRHLGYTWFPYDLAPLDLKTCFPVVPYIEGPGDYAVPATGTSRVVAARVRGQAWLQAGSGPPLPWVESGGGEALLGMIVVAPPGEIRLSTGGRILGLYVDGRPVPGFLPQ